MWLYKVDELTICMFELSMSLTKSHWFGDFVEITAMRSILLKHKNVAFTKIMAKVWFCQTYQQSKHALYDVKNFIACNLHSSCHLSQKQISLAMEVDEDPSRGLQRILYIEEEEEEIGRDCGHWD